MNPYISVKSLGISKIMVFKYSDFINTLQDFNEDKEKRLLFGRHIAEVTHLDQRAVEGALFVSEVGAILSRSENLNDLCKRSSETTRFGSRLALGVNIVRMKGQAKTNLCSFSFLG